MTTRAPISHGLTAGLVGLIVLVVLATRASAQSCDLSWTQIAGSGPAPTAREKHAMAYDSDRGAIVLFGGEVAPNYQGDTWEWDGNSWTQKFPESTPPARAHHAMAYDTANGVVVLFGGWDGSSFLNDTWEWDGTDWTEVCDQPPCAPPSARQDHKMVYDGVRRVVVLYGGYDGSALGDTWEWNGTTTTWTEQSPAATPGTRHVHAMAYDCSRAVVVLYGGAESDAGNTEGLKDTWEYDGSNWTQVCTNCPPGPRIHLTMAYDGARGRSVLFGGVNSTNSCDQYSDSWAWDGSTWVQVAGPGSGPDRRTSTAIAFDGCRARLVVFGGIHCRGGFQTELRSDTWSLGFAQCREDLNDDRVVNVLDLIQLLLKFGQACP